MVGTFRGEEAGAAVDDLRCGGATLMELGRLSDLDVVEMARRCLGNEIVPAPVESFCGPRPTAFPSLWRSSSPVG